MKILIKSHLSTETVIQTGKFGNHISSYHVFNHLQAWEKLGYEVHFTTVAHDWENYDVLFFRGYNSFRPDLKNSIKMLKEFKGKKILYLEGLDNETNIGQYFDVIFIPELDSHYNKWKEKYPNKDIRKITWTSTDFELIDKGKNPYPDNKFRCIYTGIYNDRMLKTFNELAKMDENIVLGGIYYDGKVCRGLGENEVKELSSNIQIINNNTNPVCNRGLFEFGEQYPYLRYADVALNLYAYDFEGSLSSKLIDYLCCGLPVVCEDTCPNRYRVGDWDGIIIKWNNFNELFNAIHAIKFQKLNKQEIMNKAREIHNPITICKEILK